MANLASIILEGSNQTPSVDLGNYDYSDMVVEESSYSDAAVATLFTDIMEAEQSYMVADVVGAATIIRENKLGHNIDPVVVSEGVVKNGIAKLKAAFQKFIAKIKEYYKRVINWFKAMFSNGEDFVKNYGDMIKKKAAKVKDFSYTGYKYTKSAGDTLVSGITDKVNAKLVGCLNGYDFIKEISTSQEFNKMLRDKKVIDASFKEDGKPTASEEVDKFLSGTLKYADIAEMKTAITEAYRDGDDKKSEIKDFEANSVDEMITYLKTSKKVISDLEKQLNNYEEKTNKVISKLNKFESEKDEQGGSNLVSNASYVSSLMTAYLNLYKAPCEVQIAIYKAMATDFLGVLKKFYNFKGNKGAYAAESAEVFDEEAYATLENYLVLEGCKKSCSEGCDEEDDSSDDEEDVEEKCGKGTTESVVAGILEQAAAFTL